MEALNDHFPCISGAEKPLESLSTTIPKISPSSFFAQTTAMSATGEFVIHIFAPFKIRQSPSSLTFVTIPAGFEPKSGSVSPKHPISSPAPNFGKYFFF